MVAFPRNRGNALDVFRSSKVPRIKWRRATKGSNIPRGTALRGYGLTQEEKLLQYAPEGTGPERLVYGWLKTHDFLFTFQESILGGRAPGGAILDFVVYDKQPPVVIRIMSYWHDAAPVAMADSIQAEALLEMGYTVEDVWERDINTVAKVNRKMQEILFGAPKYQ
jgi:hypothetical protein